VGNAALLVALEAAQKRVKAAEREKAKLLAELEESRRRTAATERRVAQTARVTDFITATGPSMNLGTSAHSDALKVPHAVTTADAVLADFPPAAAVVEEVCAAAWARVRNYVHSGAGTVPGGAADASVGAVQAFLRRIVADIAAAAAAHGVSCMRPFTEYRDRDGHDDGEGGAATTTWVDWAFTQPGEQVACAANTCLLMETTPLMMHKVARGGGRRQAAKRRAAALCEGKARLVNLLAHRRGYSSHKMGGRTGTTRDIGAVSNGDAIQLLRIDWVDDGTDTAYPCVVSDAAPLLGAADCADCPAGLRLLTRLLLTTDVTAFGLPEHGGFTPPPGYTYARLLGEGGFGVVSKVERSDGTPFALKWAKDGTGAAAAAAGLEECREAGILAELAAAGVPGVPTLVATVPGARSTGLLMAPVGVPLAAALAALPPDDDGARMALARTVLEQVAATLRAAHAAGILHGDVRPSNIILVPTGTAAAGAAGEAPAVHDAAVYLIDWGHGEGAASSSVSRDCTTLVGALGFMADELVRLSWCQDAAATRWMPSADHDMHALLYTYAAIATRGHVRAVPPWWQHYFGFGTAAHVIVDRRTWLAAHGGALRHAVPPDLRAAWDDVCRAAAPTPDAWWL